MKKFILFIAALLITTYSIAQNFGYGKASREELDMKRYDKDTSANAVVLNEFGKAGLIENNGGIRLMYEYHVKIKIFNHKGFSNGTVQIHLRNNEENTVSDEVNNLEGITTYTDDKGLTQVVELDKKKTYTTRDYKYQSTLKFAMPGLVDGCVIEYRYILIAPFFDHFHSWEFQGEIPKVNSEYEVHIPAFWRYNIALRGPLKLTKNKTEVERSCFSVGINSCDCTLAVFGMQDIPAFVNEEYMTASKNFLSSLNFDMEEYTNPYNGTKTTISTDWKDLDYQLKDNQGFGAQLRKKDLVKEHIPPAILGIADSTEKAKAIFEWVQKWFKWNDYTGMYSSDGIKKAIEMHSGSIADINITLIDALNAAGINTEAVLLSTRDHGVPDKLFPTIGDFNYVIARANVGGKSYFLDATDALLPFGILPVKCLNDQGRAFSLDKPSFWVDLDTKQSKLSTYALELTLQDDGKLRGTLNHYTKGYDAYLKRKAIKKFNTVDEYVDNLDEHFHGIRIIKSKIMNLDSLDEPLTEQYEIEVDIKNNPDSYRFVLNPYLFDKTSINPFRLAERSYPVDLGMPSENRYVLSIHIPDNYIIENKLQSVAIALPNQGGRFLSNFENDGNNLTLSKVMQFNRSIYQPGEYPYLKEFYNKIILAEKEEIVFKKK